MSVRSITIFIFFLTWFAVLASQVAIGMQAKDFSGLKAPCAEETMEPKFIGPRAFLDALAVYGTNICRDEASEALFLRGLEMAIVDAAKSLVGEQSRMGSMELLEVPDDGIVTVSWGYPGSMPVRGDYDGDGADDLALYSLTNGNWYIGTLDGRSLAWGTNWGGYGYTPVAGDYNGDGRSDLAVWDRTNWYIRTLAGQVLAWRTN